MDKQASKLTGSKAAVQGVLRHKPTGYIPLGTYAIDCDTVRRVLGRDTFVRDKAKIQLALWEGRRDEVAQSLKEDAVELFKKLDCIDVIIAFKEAQILPPKDYEPQKVKKLEDGVWQDERGVVYKLSVITNDILPVGDARPVTDVPPEKPVFNPPDESIFEAYDCLVDALSAERVLLGSCGGFGVMPLPGGMENALVEYLLNPDFIKSFIEYNTLRANFYDSFYINRGTDYVMAENDMAATNGPLISPALFREMVLPAMRERVAHIKQFTDAVFLHCCGNTFKIIDMFIEAGIDVEQSLQTTAGMDLGILTHKYGEKLAFWGGVAVEKLIEGTMEDVRDEVRKAYGSAAPGGSILGPSHSIAYGVKYDNFMAMLDEHTKLRDRI